ncbi:MAG: cytochrome b N-terminal domain-containing protein [Chloroflexota bacterium]
MVSMIWKWLNERWPLSQLIHLSLDEEITGGSSFAYTLGSATLTVFILQAVTGVLQLFFYVPTVDHAYDSISFLRTDVAFGWLVNGLHYWGANAMVVLICLHLARVFVWGAYKHPREMTWLLGVGLLMVTMGLSFTGGPLPWDQRGYWAAEVGTSIPGSIPVVGDIIKHAMRGGEEMGQLTLSRLFAVHTSILPPTLLALIVAHLIAFRRFGSTGPWDEAKRTVTGPFWPDQVFKDAVVATCIVLILVSLVVFTPKPFSGPADPLDTSYIPKPEWNFLFLYQALKFFPGRLEPVGAVGVPTLLVSLLILLPFIDRRPDRNPSRRHVAMMCGAALAAVLAGLTVAGYYSTPSGEEVPTVSAPLPVRGTVPAGTQKGMQLFRSTGCTACHRINGKGGVIGPDLSQEGARGRTREWLITQIRDPKKHFPDTVMPSYTTLSDQQVGDIADYLLSLGAGGGAPAAPPPATGRGTTGARVTVPDGTATKEEVPAATAAADRGRTGPAAEVIGSAERGAVLFERECASCHGSEGKGGVANPGSEDGTVPPLNPIDRALFNDRPRLFAENIDRIIQHGATPVGQNPALRMPAFGQTTSLTQEQIANIEAYLLSLNGVDRAKIVNPGMAPTRFFFILVPSVIIVMMLFGGLFRCVPQGKKD